MTRLGPLLSPVLVGRDDLLEQADRRVAEAAAGRGRLVLLAGEAGIGKSRFIASIVRKAKAAGFVAAEGLVAPQDADVPAASILDLARTMARMPEFESLGRALLERVRTAPDATQGRRRAFVHDLADQILAAVDRPTMLWFDDLQWADEISLDVVGELARAATGKPLLVVAAYRTDEVAPGALLRGWRSRLLSQRLAEEARLSPLTLDETGQLAAVILGEAVSREVAASLYERTDGVPLHVEELLGALDAPLRLDARAVRDAAVPQTLEDAIIQRVARLTPEAQAVARAGAVIGRCFVPSVLAGIMDIRVDELDAPLRELVEHNVIEPPGPRGLYDFRHQLLRDALYGAVPPADLRRFHGRAAEFGRSLEGSTEVHASVHYERAGMRVEAFHSALAGARAAARVLAHREAFDLFRRVIANMPGDLPGLERADILEAAAGSAGAREEIADWSTWTTQALHLYEANGDALGVARSWVGLAVIQRRDARSPEDLREVVLAALAALAPLPVSQDVLMVRSDAHYIDSITALGARDMVRSAELAGRARVDAEASGDPVQVRQSELLDALIQIVRGDVARGRDRIQVEVRRALDAADGDNAITALRWAGDGLVQILEYRAAAAFIEEGIRYGDSIEQSFCPGILAADAAIIAWADGRWVEADSRAREVLALRGSARAPGVARWPMAAVALGRGDLPAARRLAADALAFGERAGEPVPIMQALWAQAEIALIAHDPDGAIVLAERAIRLAEGSEERAQAAPFAITGARALVAAGRPADAARWTERIATLLAGTAWASQPAVDHARGIVAMAEGANGVARQALERAVVGWDAMPRIWEALWARLDLAVVLLRSGRHVEAASLVGDVRERAERLDSRPLCERADEIARQARGRLPEEAPWHPLSTRELEVARLIAAGLTNPAIAQALGIAPKTVSAHVEHILAKLGVSRRAEVAAWVGALGVGPVGELRRAPAGASPARR